MDNCDQSWEAFGILSWLIRGLNHIGVSRTTPVQRAVTALINKDVVVEAPTGSGKTLAFLVPLICRLLLLDQPQRHHYQALILAPTRELASMYGIYIPSSRDKS